MHHDDSEYIEISSDESERMITRTVRRNRGGISTSSPLRPPRHRIPQPPQAHSSPERRAPQRISRPFSIQRNPRGRPRQSTVQKPPPPPPSTMSYLSKPYVERQDASTVDWKELLLDRYKGLKGIIDPSHAKDLLQDASKKLALANKNIRLRAENHEKRLAPTKNQEGKDVFPILDSDDDDDDDDGIIDKEEIKCSICQGLISDAVFLPCLHLYCSKCLTEFIRQKGGECKCPNCNREYIYMGLFVVHISWLYPGTVEKRGRTHFEKARSEVRRGLKKSRAGVDEVRKKLEQARNSQGSANVKQIKLAKKNALKNWKKNMKKRTAKGAAPESIPEISVNDNLVEKYETALNKALEKQKQREEKYVSMEVLSDVIKKVLGS